MVYESVVVVSLGISILVSFLTCGLRLHEMGSSTEQADYRRKIQAWKMQLKSFIASPIIPARFSGKYPTKSGHLEMPYMKCKFIMDQTLLGVESSTCDEVL